MTYSINISGNAGSKKGEVEALAKAAAMAEELGADGPFGFNGDHIAINASGPDDAQALVAEAVAAYNEDADADDQVGE